MGGRRNLIVPVHLDVPSMRLSFGLPVHFIDTNRSESWFVYST